MKSNKSTRLKLGVTRGFTLVELLVVIAIIAVLASLGATVYFRASRSAKSAESVSQLKQIATAIAGYTGENGRYPPGWYQTSNLSHVEYLGYYIYDSDYIIQDSPYGYGSYLPPEQRSDSVFISPFRKNLDTSARWAHNHTYGPNPNAMPDIFDDSGTRVVYEHSIERPSSFILYADMWTTEENGDSPAAFANQPGVSGPPSDQPATIEDKKLGALHYYHDRLHAIMGDLSVRIFKKGEVRVNNLTLKSE